MAVIPPWVSISPDSFLQAAEAGERIGEASRAEAERAQAQQAQAGLESARMNQAANEFLMRSKAASEKEAYDRSEQQKADALNAMKANRPDIVTIPGGGVMSIGPSGQLTALRQPTPTPKLQKVGNDLVQVDPTTGQSTVIYSGNPKPEDDGTISVPADGANPQNGMIRIKMNSPLYKKWTELQPTIKQVPASPGKHLWSSDTPASTVTNAVPSLGTFAKNPLQFPSSASQPAAQQFNKGDQVKQDGVVYEYDGQNWNPVNQ